MVAATSRPVLSPDDLIALLDLHKVPDASGLLVNDAGYTETWDADSLNRAAAEGWRWKAGRVAGEFDFSADGGSFNKGEIMAKCLEMEAHYLARQVGTSQVAGADPDPSTAYDARELIP
jgi:hypothetical protein